MNDYLINIALSILLAVVKNPAKVKAERRALKKLRDALVALPLDDEVPAK